MLERKGIGLCLCLVMLLGWGCGKQAIKVEHQSAKNRQMALVIYKIDRAASAPSNVLWPEAPWLDKLATAARDAVSVFYSTDAVLLKEYDSETFKTATLFHQYGQKKVDDLFLVSGKFSREDGGKIAFAGNLVIKNGNKFNTVSDLPLVVHGEGEKFAENFATEIVRLLTENFKNPNDYPRCNPLFFADQLFQYAAQKERSLPDVQSCDDVPKKYGAFKLAHELYETVVKSGVLDMFGMQDARYQTTSRIEEAADKTKLVDVCVEDQKKHFEIVMDYGKLARDYQPFIEAALKNAELEVWLKKYTNKPAFFRFQVDDVGITLNVYLRYHDSHYKLLLKEFKIPDEYKGLRLISFEPYFPLMKRIVLFQNSLPMGAPAQLKTAMGKMNVNLILEKIIGESVQMTVRGQVGKGGRVNVAYPYELIVKLRGYDTKTVRGKNDEIFQAKGWMALGNCRALDGSSTEDGLLYRFFGFPCK